MYYRHLVYKLTVTEEQYDLYITFRDDGKATASMWEYKEFDISRSIEIEDLSLYTYNKRTKDFLLKTCLNELVNKSSSTQLHINITELKTTEETEALKDRLWNLFYSQLNTNQILEDNRVINKEDLMEENNCEMVNTAISRHNLKSWSLGIEEVLKLIIKYYQIQEKFIYDIAFCPDSNEFDFYDCDSTNLDCETLHKFMDDCVELLLNVFTSKGAGYEYNDGAYYLESGHSVCGYNLRFKYEPDSAIDVLKNTPKNRSDLIAWLQDYRPVGVSSLRKLKAYLGELNLYVEDSK